MLERPDFSEFVVHFTKGAWPLGRNSPNVDQGEVARISRLRPFERLEGILDEKKIVATTMPWTNAKCVCFTECVWGSLLDHAARYSSYGIGFKKDVLFKHGGGPAFYVRQDLFEAQKARGWSSEVWPFLTPFAPSYAPAELRAQGVGKKVDFTHEREWRVPHDLSFEFADVEFVVVSTYEDEAKMRREFKDGIGRSKILIMDNYRKVRELWPFRD